MARPQSGPPLIGPALAVAVLTLAGVVLGAAVPRPGADPAEILAFTQTHSTALRWGAFLALGAAIPLAIWTATIYQRLRTLGVRAPGAAIALVGGVVAATMSALSGLVTWASARAGQDAPLAAALRDLVFAAGGPGFVAFFGLLLAGVSVPMVLLDIQRLWGIFGLILAAAAQISTLVLVVTDLTFLLPVVRFGGLIWLVAVSLVLPRERNRRSVPDQPAVPA